MREIFMTHNRQHTRTHTHTAMNRLPSWLQPWPGWLILGRCPEAIRNFSLGMVPDVYFFCNFMYKIFFFSLRVMIPSFVVFLSAVYVFFWGCWVEWTFCQLERTMGNPFIHLSSFISLLHRVISMAAVRLSLWPSLTSSSCWVSFHQCVCDCKFHMWTLIQTRCWEMQISRAMNSAKAYPGNRFL